MSYNPLHTHLSRFKNTWQNSENSKICSPSQDSLDLLSESACLSINVIFWWLFVNIVSFELLIGYLIIRLLQHDGLFPTHVWPNFPHLVVDSWGLADITISGQLRVFGHILLSSIGLINLKDFFCCCLNWLI